MRFRAVAGRLHHQKPPKSGSLRLLLNSSGPPSKQSTVIRRTGMHRSPRATSKVIDFFDKCSQKPPTPEEENHQQGHGNRNQQKSAAVCHAPSILSLAGFAIWLKAPQPGLHQAGCGADGETRTCPVMPMSPPLRRPGLRKPIFESIEIVVLALHPRTH